MKLFFLISILFVINLFYHHCEGEITYQSGYIPECEDYEPKIYEQDFPCDWSNEVAQWDYKATIFICHNVNASFQASYHVESISEDPNTYGFSTTIWDYHDQDGLYIDENDYIMAYSDMINRIKSFFSDWRNIYFSQRQAYVLKKNINSPLQTNDFAYDFSVDNHDMPLTELNSPRNFLSPVIFYIDREQSFQQFPCYYFLVSLTVE